MGGSEHRVGRLVFELPARDQHEVERLGALVRTRFDAVIAPSIQEALDRIDRPGELVRIDRVDVSLGAWDALGDDPGAWRQRLVDGLVAALSSLPDGSTEHDHSIRAHEDELATFLETGIMRWAEPGAALRLLTESLLRLDARSMRQLAVRLRPVLVRRRATMRLVTQLPLALVKRIWRAMLLEEWSDVLDHLLGPDRPFPDGDRAPVNDSRAGALGDAVHRTACGPPSIDLGEALALFASFSGESQGVLGIRPVDVRPSSAPTTRSRPDMTADDDPPTVATTQPVHAAGAVLLHPFLGTLFDRLGLLAARNRFRDVSAAARAVLLAHHVATGADEAPEPETILFKLLCGLPFAEPVPRHIELSDEERTETASVLAAVIEHWRRLGHTSPSALRESFLMRPGLLRRDGGGWRLVVEQRGVDVLLNYLPWALSLVKTPFMSSPLAVEWR